MIGQFRWTHLLGWNVWQKPKYKFCVIMLITHVSILMRWDVKWFNFCQLTLLDQQCSSTWPQPYKSYFGINKTIWVSKLLKNLWSCSFLKIIKRQSFTWHDHLAVSSQGMQDHLGAKSGNWSAGWIVNLVSNFPILSWAKPWNEDETSSAWEVEIKLERLHQRE